MKCCLLCLVLFAVRLMLQGWLYSMCTQLRCNPKAMSHCGLEEWRRRPRTEMWWRVGSESEWGKGSLPKDPFAPCVWEHIFMCMHMWSTMHMCGKKESLQQFSFLSLFLYPPPPPSTRTKHTHTHTKSSQCRRQRVWPRQNPTQQRRRLREASVSLVPPNSTTLWILLQNLFTHSDIPTSLYPVCFCISYDLAEAKRAYACASAGMCVFRVLAVFSMQPYQKILWEMWF